MNVSIILVHYNTPELLMDCLKSIYVHTKGISFEVIVVDNASSKRIKPDQLLTFEHLKWIQNNKNIGFGQANNLGAKDAKGDYLFLLNTDTLLTSNVINGLYQKAETIQNLGVLAPRLLNQNGTVQYYGSVMGRWHYAGKKDRIVPFISGAAMFIKKTVFSFVNGFDPFYFFYNEDLDLCKTLKRAGYKLIYSPELSVVHIGGGSTDVTNALKKQALHSSLYFFKKHYLKMFSFLSPVIISLFIPILFAMPPDFSKIKSEESFSFEQYQIQPGEPVGVVGYSYRRFIDDTIYWGGTGYGAITGERGGYFIGGFILGEHIKWGSFIIEPQLFVGGGGGHSAPQGGGGILRSSLAVGYRLTETLSLQLHVGYIDFVNGLIKSSLMGGAVGWEFYDVAGK